MSSLPVFSEKRCKKYLKCVIITIGSDFMKYINKEPILIILICLGFLTFSGGIIYSVYRLNHNSQNLINDSSSKKDITSIINDFKESQSSFTLVYESSNISAFKSLVYGENANYESYLIDSSSGKINSFLDYVKNTKAYEAKLTELLNLKYPTFIVNALTSASRSYYVKENEVIIYFSNYNLEYSEPLYLTINYNEIKDYLKFTPILDEEYQNENGFNYDPAKKSVAITFDDGPSSKFNSFILETLAQNKAHATFFMVGKMMNSCPSCVINTYNSHNEIGSHTYEHLNLKTSSVATAKESLTKTDNLYYSLTNDHIKLIRPPYGAYNRTILKSVNAPFILWNLDTEDWRYHDANHITEYIKNNVSNGSIILMHELYETSLQALQEILPWLYLNGYQVVSVSELATLHNRPLANGEAYLSLK